MPLLSKLLLLLRYLLVFLVRIVCIVTFFAPFIGLWDILSHYQAETIPLHPDVFKRLNDTVDQQFYFFNLISKEVDKVHIASLFRSNYTDPNLPLPPPTTLYTAITLSIAFTIFWITYVIYGVLLTILKCIYSKEFREAGKWKKLQHIVEVLNLPESFCDWDSDVSVGICRLQEKWSQVLCEMLMMVGLQFATNMALLIPFFITGTYEFSSNIMS